MMSSQRSDDVTRPCTVCRMPVSVLAVKCHHCGAEVGRPKEASRVITAEELGGETVVHYAPSSNVMDALESFRTEEVVARTQESQDDTKTLFGRKARKADGVKASMREAQGLPELDERSRALASIAMPKRQAPPVKKKKQAIDIGEYLRYAGYALAAAAALYVGVFLAPGWISALTAEKVEVFASRVPSLKAAGAPPIDILEAAAEAMRHGNDPQFQKDIAEARTALIAQVNELVNAKTITKDTLAQASTIASKAMTADPHPEIRELKTMVDTDNRAYRTLVEKIDPASKTATFKVIDSTGKSASVAVEEGQVLADRFKVEAVSATEVRLTDTLRGDRPFSVRANGFFL